MARLLLSGPVKTNQTASHRENVVSTPGFAAKSTPCKIRYLRPCVPCMFRQHCSTWVWQLVGVTDGPSRSIGQRIQAMVLIAIEYLVARLARNAELATQLAHRFTVQQADNEAHTLFHYRTLLPRHRHLPHAIACGRCNMV